MKINIRLMLVALLAATLLPGCAPLLSALRTPTPTPPPTVAAASQPETETPPAGSPDSTTNCAFVWDTRPLDMETTMVQAAFKAKGINNVNAQLQAYGESCIDPGTNAIVRFSPMETDYYLTIQVGSLDDPEALGNQLAPALQVLRGFPADTFPGPNPGRVFVTFNAGGQLQNLSFDMKQAGDALDKGISGSALLQALGLQIGPTSASPSATPAR